MTQNLKQTMLIRKMKLALVLIFIGSISVILGFSWLDKYRTLGAIFALFGVVCNSIGIIISTYTMGNNIVRCNNDKDKIK